MTALSMLKTLGQYKTNFQLNNNLSIYKFVYDDFQLLWPNADIKKHKSSTENSSVKHFITNQLRVKSNS